MIQRIQSVYFFIVVVLSVIFMTGSILTFINSQGQTAEITFADVKTVPEAASFKPEVSMIPFAILSVLIPVCMLMAIFLFRKRKLQVKIALGTLCLEIVVIGTAIYYYFHFKRLGWEVIPGLRVTIPVVSVILTFLGIRGIRKDENLVKSYDRLR